jgi:hypothetical protein
MRHDTHLATPAAPASAPRKRRPWIGFVLAAVCGILAVFVLHGPIAGVAAAACMLGFIAACANALRSADPTTLPTSDRVGVGGFIGGWF